MIVNKTTELNSELLKVTAAVVAPREQERERERESNQLKTTRPIVCCGWSPTKPDPYADVDGVGGGVLVNFHRRRRSAAANHLQEVYKNTILYFTDSDIVEVIRNMCNDWC